MESKILAISHVERPYAMPVRDPATGKTAVGVPVASMPFWFRLVSIRKYFDEYRHRPERRKGTVRLQPDSFIDFVKRYRNIETTVMFIRKVRRGYEVTVVFNYHPAGPEDTQTGFGDWKAVTVAKKYRDIEKALNMVGWLC